MRALGMKTYGGPEALEVQEVERPSVGENDVLIRSAAGGLNAGDVFSLTGRPWLIRTQLGLLRPKGHVLGWDVAGTVEEVGPAVTRFQPGDRVFAACDRALAEFVCAPEDKVAKAPAALSVEETAALPSAGATALQALRDQGRLEAGQKVLVNGASGGVGSFAVQIAKAYGAEVTAVCSARNVAMCRELGADHVIDYTKQDFTQGEARYDLVLDNVGNHTFAAVRRVLTPTGLHLPNTGHAGMGYVLKAFALSAFREQNGRPFLCVPTAADLDELRELVDNKRLRPVIDRTWPLAEAPAAFRYLLEEHARGKVVLTL